MTLRDLITGALADLDAQIAAAKARALAEVTALKTRQAVLQQAATLITPELETAIAALQKLGIVQNFS